MIIPGKGLGGHATELDRDVDGLLPRAQPEAGHVGELQRLLVLGLEVLHHGLVEVGDPKLGGCLKNLQHSVSSLAAVWKLVPHLHPLDVLLQLSHLNCQTFWQTCPRMIVHLIWSEAS